MLRRIPGLKRKSIPFPELTYANPEHPVLKRWLIRRIEKASGRDRFANAYALWRKQYAHIPGQAMARMLQLSNIELELDGASWPPEKMPDSPIVMIANHPFGIADGIAFLTMAEMLGRPMRILINEELLKVPEIRQYSLPVSFHETKQALQVNMNTRKEALAFLKTGGTVLIFPGGGVATARNGFGQAQELPWKTFTARLVQSANATVIPVYFHGQNGRIFHIASRVSATLRTSLFIHEFRQLSGRVLRATVGEMISPEQLAKLNDRNQMIDYLKSLVLGTRPKNNVSRRPLRSKKSKA